MFIASAVALIRITASQVFAEGKLPITSEQTGATVTDGSRKVYEGVTLLMFALCAALAFIRWEKGGRLFVIFQVLLALPWIAYGVWVSSHGKPDYALLVTIAGYWMLSRISDLIHKDGTPRARIDHQS
jgi:hypothetical protein